MVWELLPEGIVLDGGAGAMKSVGGRCRGGPDGVDTWSAATALTGVL